MQLQKRLENIIVQSSTALDSIRTHLPRNAYGDMAPFLMDTMMVIPDSRNGELRSIALLRTLFMTKAVKIMSALSSKISRINPFHVPLS